MYFILSLYLESIPRQYANDRWGYVPIKLYSWTQKLEFYIIFMCHEYYSFNLFQPFRNAKAILSS